MTALFVLLIACALVLPNLGDRRLWQDEAETALVASNVLHTGVPTGWDGKLLITQDNGHELTDSFLWAWTPWLMHYVAAFGMAVLGENSLGARWPFALLGCLSFPVFYLLLLRATKDRFLTVVTVILMLTSVQYLLLMRQCRYYPLLPILFFLSLWGYGLLPSKRGMSLLSMGMVLLFHSNFVACAMVATGFLLHAILFRRRDSIWKQLAICGVILAAGSLPWIAATSLLSRATPPGQFGAHFAGTLIMSNRYVCPWIVLLGLGFAYARRRIEIGGIDGLSICMLVPMFFFLPEFLWPNPRYVPFLLPVGALLMARALCTVFKWSPWVGAVFAAAAIGSNILIIPVPALVPTDYGREVFAGELETGTDALGLGFVKAELGGYLFELTHSVRGPDEELVSFLEANTSPNDIIASTNDWLPMMFHTKRRFAGVISPDVRTRPGWDKLPPYVSDATLARWLILRPQHPLGSDSAARADLVHTLEQNGIRVEKTLHLDINDVHWINRPMLSKHVFRMPEHSPAGVYILLLSRTQ